MSDAEITVTWTRVQEFTWTGDPAELPEGFKPPVTSPAWDDPDELTENIFNRITDPSYAGVPVKVAAEAWYAFEAQSELQGEEDPTIVEVTY